MAQTTNKPNRYGTLEIIVPPQKVAQRRPNLAQYEDAQVVGSECRSVRSGANGSIVGAVAGLVVAVVLAVVESTRISIQEHRELTAKRRRWDAIRSSTADEIRPKKRPENCREIRREFSGKSCRKSQKNTIVNYGGNITINQY